MVKELIKSRELVWNLVKRDLKTRYKASVLGFFWSFGKPLFLMLILWVVFSTVIRIPGFKERNPDMPFALHLLTGILAWTYFVGGLTDSMYSVYGNSNLIKKVKLNPAVFPAASVLANLVNYLFALVVLFGFMAAYKAVPSFHILLLPLAILIQTFLMFSLALWLSSLYVFYRDVGSILEILLTGWFYATPIIYPFWLAKNKLPTLSDKFGSAIYLLYLSNPLTPIVVTYRRLLFDPLLDPPEVPDAQLLWHLLYALCFSGVMYLASSAFFKRRAARFADEL